MVKSPAGVAWPWAYSMSPDGLVSNPVPFSTPLPPAEDERVGQPTHVHTARET